MNAVIVAVLLTVLQASPPIPGKTTNTVGSRSNGVQGNASANKTPAPLTPLQQLAEGTPEQNAGNQPCKADAKEPVLVREVAPGAVDSFWWNRFYVCFTGLLVLIGAAGICYALGTLKAIKAQTIAMRDQVIAMQRPKLEVKWVYLLLETEYDHQWKIGITVANVGGSKADVTDSDLTVKRLGIGPLRRLLRAMPLYEKKYSFGQFSVAPGERQDRIIALNANTDTKDMKLLHAHPRDASPETVPFVCFGFLRYIDKSNVGRQTGFGWQWNPEDMSFTRLEYPNYEYTD